MLLSSTICRFVWAGAGLWLSAAGSCHGAEPIDKNLCREKFASYKEALAKNPTDEQVWTAFRGCTTALKRWTEAAEVSEAVLKKNPEQADAHLVLGISQMHTKDHKKAAEHFRETIRLKPDFALPYYHYGMSQLFLNRPAEASQSAEKAIVLEPTNPIHYSQLAYANLLLDEPAKCETAARRAIELDRNNVAAYKVLGTLYAKQGKKTESEKAFEEAIHANGRLAAATPFVADKRELPGMEPQAASPASPVLPPSAPPVQEEDTTDPVEACVAQWETMREAAIQGDFERALAYFSDYSDTREQYRAAFQRLGSRAQQVFAHFSDLSNCQAVLGSVTCKAMVRNPGSVVKETTVRCERNSDRIWRIRSF